MRFAPVIGDKYQVTYEQLGRPSHRQDIEVAGLGVVVVDEADVHYGQQHEHAAFFVRPSKALGGRFVVVSRVQAA
jgi:hypothetical protein